MFLNWFTRIWRGLWGALFEQVEDPELTLKQLMRDMRAKVPQMRMAVANALGARNLAAADMEEARRELAGLEPKILAAVKAGPAMQQAAEVLIMRKKALEAGIPDKEAQVSLTQQAADQAKQMLDAYEREVERRQQEAISRINRNKQAKMIEQMAQLRQSFEVGDDANVLQEVGRRIDERHAKAVGMLEVAGRSTAAQLAQVEIEAARLSVSDEYREYQKQLGMSPEGESTRQLQPSTETTATAPETETQTQAPPTVEPTQ